MNSNINIMITAAAAQATQTINRVQSQLRALSVASRTTQASSNGPWFNSLIPAQGRIARTQAQLKSMTGATTVANAASNRPWFASMTASGSHLQWIGRQLTTNFTLPVVAAAAMGVKFGLDMEKSMTRVAKVYGDGALAQEEFRTGVNITSREVKALERNFIALSDKYGVQADEVAGVAAEWAAAGSSGAALAKQTELTMQTMILGEMDAADATKALIAIQAQWGVDTNGLTTILRDLNAVENETGTRLDELVVAYGRASASARTAGVDTAHLSAMIAALVPAAGSASEAGNSLKTIFSRMMKPTKDFTAVLGAMNINTGDTAWQSRNAGQRLQMLAEKFKGLTAPQRSVVASLAAGNWQINRLQQLMMEMGSKTGYYGRTLELMADKNRVAMIAEQELQRVLESSPQRMKQAGTIIQNSMMKAMEPLIPVIVQVSLWFGKLFRAFSNISPQIRTTVIAILLLLGALGPLIVMAGIVKLSIGQLAPVFMFLGRALMLPLAPLKLLRLSFWATAAQSVIGSKLMAVAAVTMSSMAAILKGVAIVTVAAWKLVAMGAAVAGRSALAAWRTSWAAMIIWQSVTGTVLTMRQMIVFTTMLAAQNMWASASTAIMRAWSATTTAVMTLWGRIGPAVIAVWSATTLAIQKAWKAAWISMQASWHAASIIGQAAWAAASTLGFALWRAATLAVHRSWSLAWLTLTLAWAAASTSIQLAWARAMPAIQLAATAAMLAIWRAGTLGWLAIQKAWALGALLLQASTWKGLIAVTSGGIRGIGSMLLRAGAIIIGALASPWIIAIGAVVGLIVIFRKQIAQAFNNIIAYFKNLPAETAKGLSPITNIFVKIKNVALRAFNALPNGIKNALLKVVAIVRAAALKIYELFSYINPFAHHSPSLVENVTNGMEVVNQQFTNSANHAKRTIGQLHASIKTLQGLSKPVTDANDKAAYDEVSSNASKAGVANAMPAYDKLNADVKAGKAQMESLNKTIEAQEAKLKRLKDGVDAYDRAIAKLNSELAVTQKIQDDVSRALDGAKAKYDRFANAQIQGMGAAEDAAFANTMAQKRLQLQIAKMEQESGTIDSVTDSYSKLQGEIETLTAKQTELRKSGAGSDILGTYDKMIADLKAQQGGLMTGSADSPAGKIAALNNSLQALQKQADIMDLEKSLKFDSLNRNLEKFKSNVEEMPYGQIMSGLDSAKTSVNSLQFAYDNLGYVMDGQNAQIAQLQSQRDQLQKVYDAENTKLEAVKNTYQEVEQTVRDGEQALSDFASSAEEAVRRQEEAARAAEEVGKKTGGKKGGKGGGSGVEGPGLQAFNDAAEGDFMTYGGSDVIGREGGLGDQTADIDKLTAGLNQDIENALGGMNPFEPIKKWWNKTVDWFKGVAGPVGDVFGNIGSAIGNAFNPGENENVSAFGGTFQKIADTAKGFWDQLKKVGELIGGLFGPDLLTTVQEIGSGFADVWGKIMDPLRELGGTIMPFLKAAWEVLLPVIGLFIGALEVVWEVINGAIGPVFSWLGDVIAGIIKVITGVIKIITGAINVVVGIVQTIIGVIKGIFTGDFSGAIDGLKKIFVDGFGKIFGGIWDIVKGIWQAIWSTIKNFVKLIWNTVWGFVKGVIDFFTHLWDVLVGHSIVPDTINSIIDWFLSLPGKILGGVWNFIKAVIGFFAKLPGMILSGLGSLGSTLWGWISGAFTWLVQNGPSAIMGFLQWIGGLELQILGWLGDIGSKLWEWIKSGFQWIVDNGPDILMAVMNWVIGIPGQVLGWLGSIGSKLLEWIKAGFQWIVDNGPDILMSFLQWVGGIELKVLEWLGSVGSKLGEWIRSGFNWIVDNAGDLLSKFWDWVKNFPKNFITGLGIIGDKLGDWMRAGWDWIVDNGPKLLGKLWDWAKGIPKSILEKLGDAGKVLWDFGKNMIQGLLDGAGSLLKKMGEFMLDLLPGWIKTPFKKAMGIASPSKVFKGYGENIGEGLIVGMGGMEKQVQNASHAMAAAADAGEVGGLAISAVADTSSASGAVGQLSAATAGAASKAGAIDVAATADVSADPSDIDYAAAQAALTAFIAESTTQLEAFNVSVTTSINGMVAGVTSAFVTMQAGATAAFTNMNTIAVSQFTAMQTSVVTIVTTMVTTVNGQLQLLVTYVTAFGSSFNAAWNSAWQAWQTTTTNGVNHTLSEWERMAESLNSTLDNGIRPVFDDMKTMLTELEDSFSATVENIGTTWENVETKTKKPAGIVVNEVYNKGLRGAWNKFNDFLGIEQLPEFTVPYKTGGAVYGPGNGTSDSVNARLSRGEHVITAKEVQGAGGHQAIMAQRKLWASGGARQVDSFGVSRGSGSRVGPGFADGGIVNLGNISGEGITTPIQQAMWDAVRTAFPNAVLNSATRTVQTEGHPDNHNYGRAIDIGGPMDEIARWIYKMNAKTPVLELIHWPLNGWQNLKNGSPLDYGAETNSGHMDHVHWAMDTMVSSDGKIISMAGGSSGGAMIDYSKLIETTFNDDIKEVTDKLPKIPGVIGEWPIKSADVSKKKALDFLKPLAKKMSISSGSLASPWAGAPDASVVQKVKEAMKPYGWDDGEQWEALNQLIGHESSWNPNAQNPGSTAYGLFQFLDTTWSTVGGQKTSDPYQQAVYGGRYIKNKYNDPVGAWAFWQNPQPNPYGGNWYDAGGFLQPGSQVVHNQTGGPEPVLTSAQWNAMYTLAGNVNVLTPEDVQDAVEKANEKTGNTADKQAEAIIKGMDVWQKAWTPEVYDATEASVKASNESTKASIGTQSSTVLLSKSLGAYSTQISALSKALVAFSNSAQSSVKVTVNVKTGETTTSGGTGSVTKNSKGETVVTVAQPTFEQWAPTINAFADLLDALPYAERNWDADNPVAGETEKERKARIAQNNMTNYAKGAWNVLKDVGPVVMKHTAIIGTAAERLMTEDGPAWTAAMAMIATGNPGGYALATLLAVKAVATLLPLVIAAIMDIVPALIRAIVRFLTQFMPDSVFAYADMAAAEDAVREQQEGGATAQGQGRRYPTDAQRTSNGNENINLYMYGDLVMPNVSDGSDANDFIDQLKLLASK